MGISSSESLQLPISTAVQAGLNLKYDSSNAPYTVYQAIVSQTSTSAPTASVKVNTLGVTLNWGRTSSGIYTITAASGTPFTANKTVIILSNPAISLVSYTLVVTSTTVITMTTLLSSVIATVLSVTATDALLNNVLVEIRVYT